MDFSVEINGELMIWDTYRGALYHIDRYISQWNNFNPDYPLVITIKKVPSKTDTIGINVTDESATKDQVS